LWLYLLQPDVKKRDNISANASWQPVNEKIVEFEQQAICPVLPADNLYDVTAAC